MPRPDIEGCKILIENQDGLRARDSLELIAYIEELEAVEKAARVYIEQLEADLLRPNHQLIRANLELMGTQTLFASSSETEGSLGSVEIINDTNAAEIIGRYRPDLVELLVSTATPPSDDPLGE